MGWGRHPAGEGDGQSSAVVEGLAIRPMSVDIDVSALLGLLPGPWGLSSCSK